MGREGKKGQRGDPCRGGVAEDAARLANSRSGRDHVVDDEALLGLHLGAHQQPTLAVVLGLLAVVAAPRGYTCCFTAIVMSWTM